MLSKIKLKRCQMISNFIFIFNFKMFHVLQCKIYYWFNLVNDFFNFPLGFIMSLDSEIFRFTFLEY